MSEGLQQEFTDADRTLLARLLHRPLILPEEFKSWLYKFASGDAVPHFQEILGTQERKWHVAEPVLDYDTTSSTSFVDLAHVGPQLTGLSNGTYMVVFGFYSLSGSAPVRYARAEFNDVLSNPSPSAEADVYVEGQSVMFHIVNLAQDNNNKIKVRYRTNGGSAEFRMRWLHAVQVAS